MAALAGLLPVALMLVESRSPIHLALAALSAGLLLGLALLRRDRLYGAVATAAIALGVLGWPLARHASAGSPPGQLLTELGFLLLFLGVLHSLYGARLQGLRNDLGLGPAAPEARS